jgi:hypothetical protein
MARRTIVLLTVAAAIVATAVTIGVLTWLSRPHAGGSAGDAVAALRQLTTNPGALMPDHMPAPAQGFPPGSTFQIDDRSWKSDGLGGGTVVVNVTPPGSAPQSYLAVMIQQRGSWKVLSTIPIR